MLEIVLTSSESDKYSIYSYMKGYFCRPVYIGVAVSLTKQHIAIPIARQTMDGDGRIKMAILLAYLLILTAQLSLNSKKSTG